MRCRPVWWSPFSNEIIATGKVTRGWLGVTLNQPMGGNAGLLVTQVADASPASQAGLLPGDLILSVNGTAAGNLIQVSGQIAETDPGGNILMSLERNGRLIEVVAMAAERPPDLTRRRPDL